jgi:hypothetical protein
MGFIKKTIELLCKKLKHYFYELVKVDAIQLKS